MQWWQCPNHNCILMICLIKYELDINIYNVENWFYCRTLLKLNQRKTTIFSTLLIRWMYQKYFCNSLITETEWLYFYIWLIDWLIRSGQHIPVSLWEHWTDINEELLAFSTMIGIQYIQYHDRYTIHSVPW